MLAYDPSTNPLVNNEPAFAFTECAHIAAMAFSIGTIMLVDLRLIGAGIRRQTSAQLVAETEMWTLGGLVVVIASGMVMFSSDPANYLKNHAFIFKMEALLTAIVYNYTVHRYVARRNLSPWLGRLVGGLSIGLWFSIVASGIYIAFI
jgi:hypothetical protein